MRLPAKIATWVTTCLMAAASAGAKPAPEVPAHDSPHAFAPRIQLALLLDTSSSMTGLIDQARTQLWSIVNELAKATRDGVQPELEVAVYEYGNDALSAESRYTRRVVSFTRDLDRVSEALFALSTNGGSEYCGASISRAIDELAWSTDERDLRVVYIAGNEPFNQGPVDFRSAVAEASQRDIRVNTIHCGDHATGITGLWHEGARLAGGVYLHIDHDLAVAELAAPQDSEIHRLNDKLNQTYIPYGAEGEGGFERQAEQDSLARSTSGANLAKRAASKVTGLLDSSSWDLVDALASGDTTLSALQPSALPASMRDMTPEEQAAFVQANRAEREKLTAEIRALTALRDAFVAAKRRELAQDAPTLGEAVVESVRSQAEAKAYAF